MKGRKVRRGTPPASDRMPRREPGAGEERWHERGCARKRRHPNKKAARDYARANRLNQRAYHCTFCHGYHLTTKKPAGG